MTAASLFAEVARRAARRPRATLLVVLALALAGGALATSLAPTAATDTLVGRSNSTYQATQRYHRLFGDDAVIVLIRGPLPQLVLTQDLERVLGLEGCLSGNLPPRVAPPGGPRGPCAVLARTRPVQVVYGPGTFINESVRQITDQLTRQTQAQIAQIRRAVAMPEWHLQNGGSYVVTGIPVVVSDLTKSITDSVLVLLVAVALVMALTLALSFRRRLPLLPLGVALCAAGLTFGGLALVGAPLTMATIAVLPILIGLGVDYAIQFQSRVAEARRGPPAERVARAISIGAPTIAAAGAATAGALLALVLSPVPMVRGFALLLIVGMVLAFACTLTAGAAAMARWGVAGNLAERAPRPRGGPLARAGEGAAAALASGRGVLGAAWRGAGELVVENGAGRVLSDALAVVLARGRALGRAS